MPKPQRKPRLRTIQPPHPSDKFTLEEAIAAWRYADEQLAARARAAEISPDPANRPTRASYPTPDEVSG